MFDYEAMDGGARDFALGWCNGAVKQKDLSF